jgi:hypothetical protein
MNYHQRKALRKEVSGLYEAGQKKSDIYELLKDKVPSNEQGWLASLIAEHIQEEVKEKNRNFALVLMFLLFASFIVWFYAQPRGYDTAAYLQLAFALVMVALLNLSIYRFEAGVYIMLPPLSALASALIIVSALIADKPVNAAWAVLPLALLVLSIWLRRKVFPEMNDWGKVKKDSEGNFIFFE